MEEKQEIQAYIGEPYVTYKFYDERGRRLSIFAEMEEKNLHITVYTCSKKDQFSRRVAKHMFFNEFPDGHPNEFTIPIKDSKPKWTFINWCRENYYHREGATFMFDAYVLAKGDILLPGIEPCGPLEFVALREGKVPKTKKNGV